VDNACYKCGSPVQPGTAFCPNCGAPQIRVTVPDAAPVESPVFVPGTPAEMQPPAQPVQLGAQPLRDFDVTGIQWRRALWPIVVGGVVIGAGTMLPLGPLWIVAAILGGGAIAVGVYHRRHLSVTPITSNMGAKLGAAAGLAGYLLFASFALLSFVFSGDELRAEVLKRVQEMQTQATDPKSAEMLHEFFQKATTPEGMALLFTVALAVFFFLFLGFGSLGGMLGATLTRRHDAQR
jgi:hypothetical protein